MAADFVNEQDLVAVLRAALTPTPVYWGFAPFESAGTSPTLPIVVVQRLNYSTIGYEDMCEGPYMGDTLLVVDTWTIGDFGYEQGRALATAAREAIAEAGTWRLQSETDLYEPNFHAWRIQGQWLCAGKPPL
jgi:hypothetical protein